MANGHNTFDEITRMLRDRYTGLELVDRDLLLLGGLRDVFESVEALRAENKQRDDRIAQIEKDLDYTKRRSIIMLAEKHPKAAVFVAGVILLLASVWQTVAPAILAMLGLPAMPVP